uniref:LigA n=1 Tax=Parastrongyloides trichosuri TaxID=131310 RepID=A0A0N4ZA81_PARTI
MCWTRATTEACRRLRRGPRWAVLCSLRFGHDDRRGGSRNRGLGLDRAGGGGDGRGRLDRDRADLSRASGGVSHAYSGLHDVVRADAGGHASVDLGLCRPAGSEAGDRPDADGPRHPDRDRLPVRRGDFPRRVFGARPDHGGVAVDHLGGGGDVRGGDVEPGAGGRGRDSAGAGHLAVPGRPPAARRGDGRDPALDARRGAG